MASSWRTLSRRFRGMVAIRCHPAMSVDANTTTLWPLALWPPVVQQLVNRRPCTSLMAMMAACDLEPSRGAGRNKFQMLQPSDRFLLGVAGHWALPLQLPAPEATGQHRHRDSGQTRQAQQHDLPRRSPTAPTAPTSSLSQRVQHLLSTMWAGGCLTMTCCERQLQLVAQRRRTCSRN